MIFKAVIETCIIIFNIIRSVKLIVFGKNIVLMSIKTPSKELLKEWEEEDKEFREIRRRYANWNYINKQPPLIKLALIIYIETGDIYKAAKIAGMTIGEFNEYRFKANIPNIT